EVREDEVGAGALRVRRPGDGRVQRRHVREVALGRALERDVGERAPDVDADASAVERRQRVLQPHAELADHDVGAAALLRVLVLRQVLVAQAASEIADVPTVLALRDLDLGRPRQRLLVERVRDDLAHRLGHVPVVEDLLDVEVEERRLRRHAGNLYDAVMSDAPKADDFHLGAEVVSSDAKVVGELKRVLVEGPGYGLKALVVKEGGRFSGLLLAPGSALLADEVIVPLDAIGEVTHDRIQLKVAAADVRRMAPYLEFRTRETTSAEALEDESSVLALSPAIPHSVEEVANKAAGDLEIEGGENVMLGHSGKRLGSGRDVLFDDGDLVGVVLQPEGWFKRDVSLPRCSLSSPNRTSRTWSRSRANEKGALARPLCDHFDAPFSPFFLMLFIRVAASPSIAPPPPVTSTSGMTLSLPSDSAFASATAAVGPEPRLSTCAW